MVTPQTRKAFLGSLALHLSLFTGALYIAFCPKAPKVPFGVEVQLITGKPQSAVASAYHAPKPNFFQASTPVRMDQPAATAAASSDAPPAAGSAEAGRSDGVETERKERYVYELRQWIDAQKKYPPVARSLRQQGRVEVTFAVKPDGAIQPLGVTAPSAHPVLDRAALQLIESLGRFKPFPSEMKNELGFKVTLPIEYRLL